MNFSWIGLALEAMIEGATDALRLFRALFLSLFAPFGVIRDFIMRRGEFK